MKTIPLSQGYYAMVDDADYSTLSRDKWYAKVTPSGRVLAQRTSSMAGGQKRRTVLMHREIMGVTGRVEIDHVDGNALNNRRKNLRAATSQQNKFAHRRKAAGVTSRFRGVSWDSKNEKWSASIKINNKSKRLGRFDAEEEAALAYRDAAKALFKEYAQI